MDIDNLQLPSFTEIQAARTPTLRHVPVAARHTWNHILTRALAAVVHRNDERAWRELLMLPQCLLCAPTRGGRRHSKAVAAYTLDRLHRWQEGERLSPFGPAGLWVVLAELHRPVQMQKGVWRPAWLAKGLTERRVLPYFPKGFAPKVIPQPKPFKRSIPGARHPVPHHSMTFPLARTSPLTW